ncbi:MAG: DUF1071 domain-containing protein [Clostridia bacterium]|nr:DUF1071 domain-containing protein [Clostridia bacterium]
MENYFSTLNNINVNGKTEKKNGLTYLSWAWAWGEVKKLHPDATYTIYENASGLFYHTDGSTCWVKTGVTVNGIEHIEYLPVMDYKNKSIPVDKVTSFDVNKAIQRSLTKAVARHGLGLYIYAGEDLPEEENTPDKKAEKIFDACVSEPSTIVKPVGDGIPGKSLKFTCADCGKTLEPIPDSNGKPIPIRAHADKSEKMFGRVLCLDCIRKINSENANR